MEKNKHRQTLLKAREDAIRRIAAAVAGKEKDTIIAADICECASPIVRTDPANDDYTMTLDRISHHGDQLFFDASSCWENATFKEDDLDVETLTDIADWLEENLEDDDK